MSTSGDQRLNSQAKVWKRWNCSLAESASNDSHIGSLYYCQNNTDIVIVGDILIACCTATTLNTRALAFFARYSVLLIRKLNYQSLVLALLTGWGLFSYRLRFSLQVLNGVKVKCYSSKLFFSEILFQEPVLSNNKPMDTSSVVGGFDNNCFRFQTTVSVSKEISMFEIK